MQFVTKQDDTRTALKARLIPVQEPPSNVHEIRFRMATITHKTLIDRVVDEVDWPYVLVIFTPEEVKFHGLFLGEFVIIYNDGKRETVPNTGYITINILRKLGE